MATTGGSEGGADADASPSARRADVDVEVETRCEGGGGMNVGGETTEKKGRPNVVIIMADDMGFSDLGCFGSEIETPNLDSLAADGVRFSQMYNCARCCPSRAALLTGLYPHRAGIGHMVNDDSAVGGPAYQGYLRDDCVTIAEVFRSAGYRTYMTGKWHVGGECPPHLPDHWVENAGRNESHPLPVQRGFDEHYGTLGGGGSYYDPPSLVRNDRVLLESNPDGYYYTDAINDEACRMVREGEEAEADAEAEDEVEAEAAEVEVEAEDETSSPSSPSPAKKARGGGDVDGKGEDEPPSRGHRRTRRPFFLYVAHTAPHWPLHAPREDIDRYRGRYLGGWDELRRQRHERLQKMGMISDKWDCSPRDEHAVPWHTVVNEKKETDEGDDNDDDDDDDGKKRKISRREWEDARMATYAAQVDVMDRGIGRILQTLGDVGQFENTLLFFLSDNGGCAEFLKENGEEGNWPEYYGGLPTSDGRRVKVGNDLTRLPGGPDTFMSYDLPWANASNTPFRLFKSWVHEGGVATPFLVHWPSGIPPPRGGRGRGTVAPLKEAIGGGRIHHGPWIMMDIVATCYEVCGVDYPRELNGRPTPPLHGESFSSILRGDNALKREGPIFWEHQGNRAVRDGRWKLVNRHGVDWELFDMEDDRTELHDLAAREPERVRRMVGMWEEWAARCGVRSWPLREIPEGERDWSHVPWLW